MEDDIGGIIVFIMIAQGIVAGLIFRVSYLKRKDDLFGEKYKVYIGCSSFWGSSSYDLGNIYSHETNEGVTRVILSKYKDTRYLHILAVKIVFGPESAEFLENMQTYLEQKNEFFKRHRKNEFDKDVFEKFFVDQIKIARFWRWE